MKIGKIFLMAMLLSTSCFNAFGMENQQKFNCISCEKPSSYYTAYAPFNLDCKLKPKWKIGYKCYVHFNEFNLAYIKEPQGPYFKELTMMRCCVFCNKEFNKIVELFNSKLDDRVKSLIYKAAKYHDKKNGTLISSKLYDANPKYFGYLNQICLTTENILPSRFVTTTQPFDVKKLEDFFSSNTCQICYSTGSLNDVPICSNGHINIICKSCLDKVIRRDCKCPLCRQTINTNPYGTKPLPENFNLTF